MANFRYRLATLLRLREAARDDRRAQLAEAFQAESVLKGRIAELDDELEALKRRIHQGIAPGRVQVDQVVDTQRYEMLMHSERHVIDGQIQTLAPEIQRRREALIAADRDVRILEKLKETQYERFLQLEAAADLKVMDEIASRSRREEMF